MSRGEYRSIHTVLVEDTDFQALDPDAKLVWYTLKMQLGPSGLGTITAWHAVLEGQTGLTPDRLQAAMKELVEEGWLRVQDNIFWIVNGLRYDPSITLSNDNHASSVQDHLRGLPKREIVNAFAEDHEELEKPWPEIGIEHPSTIPQVPHAGPMGDQGRRKTEDGRPKTEGSSEDSLPKNGREPSDASVGDHSPESEGGDADSTDAPERSPGHDETAAGEDEVDPPGDDFGQDQFCGVVREYAWCRDGPPESDWSMGREISVGEQLCEKWSHSWEKVAERYKAVGKMRDSGRLKGFLSHGQPFTGKLLNRKDEQGVPLYRAAGDWLRKQREQKPSHGMDRLQVEVG